MRRRYDFLGIGLLCILICALILVMAGCGSSKKRESYIIGCIPECRETIAAPIPANEIAAAMGQAKWEAVAKVMAMPQSQPDVWRIAQEMQMRLVDPEVIFVPCPFLVYGYATPGGAPSSLCAAGSADPNGRSIRVSTWERERIAPLITHEARNAFWFQMGRGDLTY